MLVYGETGARVVSQRSFPQQASTAALAAIPSTVSGPETFNDGMTCLVGVGTTTFHLWAWQATSTASASGTVLVPSDNPTSGRWVQLV